MGRLWCADLPTVTVPQGTTPKHVTLIYPYYECPLFFARQVQHWIAMSVDLALRGHFSMIVVDDGSREAPAREVLRRFAPLGLASWFIRLFEIEQDVRWNWLAARNVGFHHADGWCLVTDMDHVVKASTLKAVIYGDHDPSVIYGFSRIDVKGETEEPIAPHPNSWLLTREMFWKVGGYDEGLSGLYGSDGDWRRRCAATAPMQILSDALLRYEYVDDSSTTRYQRKQPEDAAVKRLVAARGKHWTPKTLSFPYHEVTA